MPIAPASPASERSTFKSSIGAVIRTLKEDRPDEAFQICKTLIEMYPDLSDAWFLYGVTALETGDVNAAIQALERANTMHGVHASYKRSLARAYRLAGRTDDAATIIEQALRLEPAHPEAILTLGVIRIAQGNKNAGMQLCRRGFGITAGLLWHRSLIKSACHAATMIGSIRHWLNPGSDRMAWVAWERGNICYQMGDCDAAIDFCRQAISLAPDQMPAIARLARLLVSRNQFETALPYLERAAKHYTDDLALQTDYATVLTHMSRFDEAIDILESTFLAGIESPRALLALGRAQAGTHRGKAARKSYKRALTLAPNSAAAHLALGRALQEEGAIEEANRFFFDTLEIDPGHAEAYLFLAGNRAIARGDKYFSRMLNLLDSGTNSREALMRLHLAAAAVFEQAGDIESAVSHYTASNDLKSVVFGKDRQAAHIGELTEDFFKQVRSWGHPEEHLNHPLSA